MYITLSILLALVAWRWGDWKNWRQYHATMLYLALMNFTYYYYTNHTELWEFHSVFSHAINETIHNFIINPLIVFIFLSNYPKRHQKIYIIGSIVIFSLLEGLEYMLGYISYNNGWSIWWSVFLYVLMFPMLRLHYTKPLWAYVLSIGQVLFFLKIFNFI
jgi:hypothetical protein